MNNNIYRILTQKNMSQAELARRIGMKRGYINRIINCKVTPTLSTAFKITKALGKTIEDLWFEEEV